MTLLYDRIQRQSRTTSKRLVVLALCAVLPALSLIWVDAALERRDSLQVAEQRVLELAKIAAEQQNSMVLEADNLLRVLAHVPAVIDTLPEICHKILMNVADDHPQIINITATNESGKALCNNQDERPDYNIGDRGYFRKLMGPEHLDFALSELVIGKRNGKPTIIVAVPLAGLGADGRPKGIVTASLSMDWAGHLAHHLPDTEAHAILVIDIRDGTLLASSSNDPQTVGHQFPDHPLMRAIRDTPGGGVITTIDFSGKQNVFGFTVLPGTRGHMVVAVGLAEHAVFGDANRHFNISLALVIGVTGLAMLLCLFGARAWLIRPGATIVAAVQTFGMGDMRKRIPIRGIVVTEMKRLATTFNAMADAIEENDCELKAAHAALVVSELAHRTLAENVIDMITRVDPNFVRIYVSPSCETLLGYRPDEMLHIEAGNIVHEDDTFAVRTELQHALRQGAASVRASYRGVRKDGSCVWLETSGQRTRDASGYVFVTRDISERKRFEASLEGANQQLEKIAREDALTGLANRRRFDEVLDMEWRRAVREVEPLALLMIDLDRFKAYNDTFGHPVGDTCLRAVAEAVGSVLRRPADLAARYGGEEIAVILPNTDRAGAAFMAERLMRAIRALCIPHPANPSGVVTISVGAASSQPCLGDEQATDLLAHADRALYQAKQNGRDQVGLTDSDLNAARSKDPAPVGDMQPYHPARG